MTQPQPPLDPQPVESQPTPGIETAEEEAADDLTERLRSKPVVGIVMLVVGLLAGYFGRPALERWITPPAPTAAPAALPGPQPLPRARDELMPYLISQTRHFKGNSNAPITLIEFADFQ